MRNYTKTVNRLRDPLSLSLFSPRPEVLRDTNTIRGDRVAVLDLDYLEEAAPQRRQTSASLLHVVDASSDKIPSRMIRTILIKCIFLGTRYFANVRTVSRVHVLIAAARTFDITKFSILLCNHLFYFNLKL